MNNLNKLLQSTSLVGKTCLRNYAFKSDLKIKWVRPEKISCIKPEKSGDLSSFPKVNDNEYMLHYEKSKELATADENVKKLFKLTSLPRRHTTELVGERIVSQVQRHSLDYGSMESKIASMTVSIRNLQSYMEKFPRNKRVKVELKEMIDKRKKFLKYLRRWDYKRFEWILEKLDLVYKPPPAEFHWITRKESLVKLTDQHCEKIKQERLDAYRKQLESQQLDFLANKLKNLQFIRKEQVECKLPVTVSPEEIAEVKNQYEVLLSQRQDQDEVVDVRKARRI